MGSLFSLLSGCLILGLVGYWLAGRILGERGKAAVIAGAALGGLVGPLVPDSPIITMVGSVLAAILVAIMVHFLTRRSGKVPELEERQHGQQPI